MFVRGCICADKNNFHVSGCLFEDVSVQIKNHFYVSGCLFKDVSQSVQINIISMFQVVCLRMYLCR